MIKFTWKGSKECAEGQAIYATAESRYEVWLPSFDDARKLDSFLRNIFSEGRRMGRTEMMRSVSNAMRTTEKLLNE